MSAAERRKHARYRIDLPVTVSVGERWLRGKIPDLSEGGFQIQADEELEPGRRASLRLERRGEPCVARGIVRWHRGRNVGVEFDELDATFRRLFDDLGTLRPAFHRTLLSQLANAEVTFE